MKINKKILGIISNELKTNRELSDVKVEMIDEVKEATRGELNKIKTLCGITSDDDFLTYIATHVVEFKSKELMSVDLVTEGLLSEGERESITNYM